MATYRPQSAGLVRARVRAENQYGVTFSKEVTLQVAAAPALAGSFQDRRRTYGGALTFPAAQVLTGGFHTRQVTFPGVLTDEGMLPLIGGYHDRRQGYAGGVAFVIQGSLTGGFHNRRSGYAGGLALVPPQTIAGAFADRRATYAGALAAESGTPATASDSFESLTEGHSATFSPDVADDDPITTTVDSVTGPGSAVVNADGFQIDVDLDPNTGGQEFVVNYTANGASASITVGITDVDIEADLAPALVQIDTSQTIADAWADVAMPTVANFSPADSVLAEGSIDGTYSEANMTAALTEGQTVAARIIVTDEDGNTETFDTNAIIVSAVAATVPSNDGTATLVDAPSSTGDQMTLNITALPSTNGASISSLQYQLSADGTTWGAAQFLSGTGAGERTITALENETLTYLQWWAVNSAGAGDPHSPALSATPSFTFTLSDATGDIEFTGTSGVYDITITTPTHYAGANSIDTANFASGAIAWPVIPAIGGGTAVGSMLSSRAALFLYDKNDVPTITGKFQRAPAGTGTWTDIAGTEVTVSTDQVHTYVSQSADEGQDIRFLTTAANGAGSVSATNGTVSVPEDAGTWGAEFGDQQITINDEPDQPASPVGTFGDQQIEITG